MKKTFYLTGIGFKILSILLLIALIALTIVLIIFNVQIPWYCIVFSSLVTGILFFACYLSFFSMVKICNEKRIINIRNIKLITIAFSELKKVEVDTKYSLNPQKHCFILFHLTNGKSIKISGFSSLFKKNGVKMTETIVSEINKVLKQVIV